VVLLWAFKFDVLETLEARCWIEGHVIQQANAGEEGVQGEGGSQQLGRVGLDRSKGRRM
jgi:hypothetical protein